MADSSALASFQAAFAAMSQRERRMVAAAAVAVGVFLIFMVTFSFSTKAESIRGRTTQKLSKLQDVQDLAAGYREAAAAQSAVERQLAASNIRLMSFLEEKAGQKGIELPTINPKADVPVEGTKIIESSVELTLTDQKLNRVLEFLQAIEGGPAIVKVKYLRLEPRVSNESVTAWLTVATYHLK